MTIDDLQKQLAKLKELTAILQSQVDNHNATLEMVKGGVKVRYEKQIAELTAQRDHYQEASNALCEERNQLREENAALVKTVAWREDEIVRLRKQLADTVKDINTALKQRDALSAQVAGMREALEAVEGLINESSGVAGLHLNGDLAPWGDLRTGGKFEEWLIKFDQAPALSTEPKPEGVKK